MRDSCAFGGCVAVLWFGGDWTTTPTMKMHKIREEFRLSCLIEHCQTMQRGERTISRWMLGIWRDFAWGFLVVLAWGMPKCRYLEIGRQTNWSRWWRIWIRDGHTPPNAMGNEFENTFGKCVSSRRNEEEREAAANAISNKLTIGQATRWRRLDRKKRYKLPNNVWLLIR